MFAGADSHSWPSAHLHRSLVQALMYRFDRHCPPRDTASSRISSIVSFCGTLLFLNASVMRCFVFAHPLSVQVGSVPAGLYHPNSHYPESGQCFSVSKPIQAGILLRKTPQSLHLGNVLILTNLSGNLGCLPPTLCLHNKSAAQ